MTLNDYIEDAYIKGWNQGWGEGWDVGQEQERLRITRSLVCTDLPKNALSTITGMSVEEIDDIQMKQNTAFSLL